MARSWKQLAWSLGIPLVARAARSPRHRLARLVTRALGAITLVIQRGRPQTALAGVGREWQRMFPAAEMVPIRRITDSTVYAEIRTPCPLRGTGDTAACHRMMEYDRRMLERIGGRLVVLRSQAEPGRTFCEVAIRMHREPIDDLVPAHRRRPRPSDGR